MESVLFQPYKWETTTGLYEPITFYVHGLTEKNDTVCLRVMNFEPHIYIELPNSMDISKRMVLLNHIKDDIKHNNKSDDINTKKIEIVQKKKLYYFKNAYFFRIPCITIDGINYIKRFFSKSHSISGNMYKCIIHEEKASYELKLFSKIGIRPCQWIEVLPTKNQTVRLMQGAVFSSAKINKTCDYRDIIGRDDIKKVIIPKIISYDIECVSHDRTGSTFPDADRPQNPIIAISATVGKLITEESEWKTYAFVNAEGNRKCRTDIQKGVYVVNCKDERALLKIWSKFITEQDPEVIISYNGLSFDDSYIISRANYLNIWSSMTHMGRVKGKVVEVKEMSWESGAYGKQHFRYMEISGRLHLDVFVYGKKTYGGLSSYTLSAVSRHFLKKDKVDLKPPEMIRKYYNNNPEDMEDIIKYCNQDTILPFLLFVKWQMWFALIEMANVVYVNISNLLIRGQSLKAYSQVYVLAHKQDIVVSSKDTDYRVKVEENENMYQGAVVQTPQIGYWKRVATYDFKSLYPTTMIAYNLCYSTYIPEYIADEKLNKKEYEVFDYEEHQGCEHDKTVRKTKPTKIVCGHRRCRFYKSSKYKGIVPHLLEFLLESRSTTRKELEKIEDEIEKETDMEKRQELEFYAKVLDCRQTQYKLSANSVYGFIGSMLSPLPFYPVAATTTALGRLNIQRSIEFMKKKYPGTITVYGDTDSCFMYFPEFKTIKEAYEKCEELEREINTIFPKPMYLELEKIYSDLFLLTKKRYVGYIVNINGELKSVDKKGLVIKRRDNCLFVRNIYSRLVDLVMSEESKVRLMEVLASEIYKLFKGEIDIHDLKINSSLNGKYKAKGEYYTFEDFIHERLEPEIMDKIINKPQTNLALKMFKRGNYIQAGDRIDYVFVDNGKKKAFEKVEDPLYYIDNKDNIKIDYLFYVKKKLAPSIDELLDVRFRIKDVVKTLCVIIENGFSVDLIPHYFISSPDKFDIVS
jgi:DNA polymerase delta subunit 1